MRPQIQILKSADFTKGYVSMRNFTLASIKKGNTKLNGLGHFHECYLDKVGFIHIHNTHTHTGSSIVFSITLFLIINYNVTYCTEKS